MERLSRDRARVIVPRLRDTVMSQQCGLFMATEKTSYVYCLMAADGTAFKIGSSLNTTERVAAIGEEFDYQASFQVEVETRRTAYRLEHLLHFMFRSHRFQRGGGDGYTEWFRAEAFSEVRSFLLEQKPKLGCSLPIKVSPKPKHTRTAGTAEREHRCIDGGQLRIADISSLEARSLQQLFKTMKWLHTNNIELSIDNPPAEYSPKSYGKAALTVFAALADCEQVWAHEKTNPRLSTNRPRGRSGGRPGISPETLAALKVLAADPNRTPVQICKVLAISRATFYKYASQVRAD